MKHSISHAGILRLAVSTMALAATGALAPAGAQTAVVLDPITVVATKTAEAVSDTLAAVSVIGPEEIEQTRATSAAELFRATPGVWFQNRADDPSQSINIRGMQDFGRVAVLIDGARQNMQRTGHSANGQFYIEPNTIAGVDVARGPVANIYGSGAIGGVVVFRTKDAEDILQPGERWAVESLGEISSNRGWNSYLQGAVRVGENMDLFFGGTYRDQSDYRDGNGNKLTNSAYDVWTGTAKATLRPADGHTIKFGYTQYESDFDSGQPGPRSTVYGTGVLNQIATARWLYAKPDDRIFNWDANVYWTRTSTDQTKLSGPGPGFGGGIGNIGDRRNFSIETIGFDLNNTSRFESGAFRHALTIGVDGSQDTVNTSGFGVVFTPSGERTVSGAFAQWKTNYSSWLEVIGALRFDSYRLSGGGVETDGTRLSPKLTVGITPFQGFQPYVTYAEGYRSPAITETLVQGIHPVIFAPFDFLPNPTLKPETGKTKEAGINLKYNDIFQAGDGFRGKIAVYRNDVENYIELVDDIPGQPAPGMGAGGIPCNNPASMFGPGFCAQYQNLDQARIEGAEFEAKYDSGKWYVSMAGSHVRGKNARTGAPLVNIMPDFITTTIGSRFLNNRLAASLRWQAVAAKHADEIPAGTYAPTSAFNVVSLYLGYQLNENAVASLAVENLFNEQYARYTQAYANPFVSGPSLYFPDPGITVKASLKVRFGG